MLESEKLKGELRDYLGTDYGLLTGSGTGALIIGLLSQEFPKGSNIIIPDITCLTVPLSVTYAKMKPIFVDVKMDDYNIDVELIHEKITKKTRAIIGVHSFGQSFDVKAIKKICEEYELLFIEDFAQSFGGEYKNKLHGSFGDISVTSFGNNKIISVGGGGAIFTNDEKTYSKMKKISERFRRYSRLSPTPERFRSRLVDSYMGKSVKRGINVYTLTPKIFKLWYHLQKSSFLYPMKKIWAPRIKNGLEQINEIKRVTIEQGRLYKEYLKGKSVVHPKYELNSGVLWRYSVLLKELCRKEVLRKINSKIDFFRFVIGYSPPLHMYWARGYLEDYPSSNFIASHILNLPLGLQYSNEQIKGIAEIVKSTVDEVCKS